jgi:CheY-like chemotaxis protein
LAWLCEAMPLPISAANGAKIPVVLLVEDEFFVRYDIASCLREAGYVVVESANGEEAIAHCRSGARIDMVFGSTTGWDVAECFRMERPDTLLLYMSGNCVDLERCVHGSVFVAKPLQHSDILNACQRLPGK